MINHLYDTTFFRQVNSIFVYFRYFNVFSKFPSSALFISSNKKPDGAPPSGFLLIFLG